MGLGKDLKRIFISLSRCVLSGSWSPLIGQCQDRESLVIAAGPGLACADLPLLGAWS